MKLFFDLYNPSEDGFNIVCLEGVNPFESGDVVTDDGINYL